MRAGVGSLSCNDWFLNEMRTVDFRFFPTRDDALCDDDCFAARSLARGAIDFLMIALRRVAMDRLLSPIGGVDGAKERIEWVSIGE